MLTMNRGGEEVANKVWYVEFIDCIGSEINEYVVPKSATSFFLNNPDVSFQ